MVFKCVPVSGEGPLAGIYCCASVLCVPSQSGIPSTVRFLLWPHLSVIFVGGRGGLRERTIICDRDTLMLTCKRRTFSLPLHRLSVCKRKTLCHGQRCMPVSSETRTQLRSRKRRATHPSAILPHLVRAITERKVLALTACEGQRQRWRRGISTWNELHTCAEPLRVARRNNNLHYRTITSGLRARDGAQDGGQRGVDHTHR